MATEEAEDRQCPEKVGLKRKLTGPPRLLLGKKSKGQAENRSEARAKRNKRETVNDTSNAASSPRHSNAGVEETGSPGVARDNPPRATQDNPPRANKINEAVSSESPEEHSRVRSISEEVDTSKDRDIRGGKVKKRCWKRVFSPAIICVRRQRKDTGKTPAGDCGQGVRAAAPNVQTKLSTLAEGKRTGEDPGSLNSKHAQDAPSNEKATKGKKRFTVQTWPTFKRFLTSSYVHRRPERHTAHVVEELSEDVRQHPVTFRKKLQGFLTRRRRVCSPVGHREQGEGTQDPENQGVEFQRSAMQNGTDQSAPDVQMDDILEDSTEVTEQCSEVVTVTAEMSAQSPEERVSPEKTCRDQFQNVISTEEQAVVDIEVVEEDSLDVENGSKMVQTDNETKTYGDVACAADKDSSTHREDVDIAMDAHKVNIDDVSKIPSSEKEDVIGLDAVIHYANSVAMDTNYHLSIQVIPSKEAPVDTCKEERTAETTSQNSQLLTNGTTDGIGVSQCSLCEINCSTVTESDAANLDGLSLEDGGWESGNSLADHHHFADDESQLVQTAYSLVQAAMNAAMEQLSREQESTATNVHREAQGCRDHA